MAYKYTDDDYCDIYQNKICDNCGKCLEINGIDTKAIKIEDISKTEEENEILEEEFLNNFKLSLDEDALNEIVEEDLNLQEIYNKFSTKFDEDPINDEEYEDAFDHIEYLGNSILDDGDNNIDEITEEIYPGVRRIKKNID